MELRPTETDSEGLANLSKIDKEKITNVFIQTVKEFAEMEGIDAVRMKTQFKVAKQIIDAYAEGKETVIVQAPTGFGKSLMAFFLSKFISNLGDGQSSYILTSNKILQEQYDSDIKNFDFKKFAMLKGQGNYLCSVNGEPFTNRACQEDSISAVQSGTKWKNCVGTCAYLVARKKAMKAETTVFNYNYFLTAMNKVYNTMGTKAPFIPRTLTVYDEAHMFGDIVQDMFANEFNFRYLVRQTTTYYVRLSGMSGKELIIPKHILSEIAVLLETIKAYQDDNNRVYELLVELHKKYTKIWSEFSEVWSPYAETIPEDNNGNKIMNADQKAILKYYGYLGGLMSSLSENLQLYQELGYSTIVCSVLDNSRNRKEFVNDAFEKQYGDALDYILKLQCTDESQLCKKFAHNFTRYSLFMSATLGNMHDYAKQTGIENYEVIEVPQVFDYDKSPIYSVSPMLSMAWKNRDMNTPKMIQRIIQIVNHHKGERGLVHTGNYDLTKKLANIRHPRIITYSNASEKMEALRELERRPDGVLAGPSVLEGVDLKDDLCRFMIFAKVPYKSLADRLTKKKMVIYKNWYSWLTMCQILQGLGRPIRNTKDWAITYLLDASFNNEFYRNPPPNYVKHRLKSMQADNIGVEYDPDADLLEFM